MRKMKLTKLFRLTRLVGIAAFCIVAVYFAYLRAIVELTGKEIPVRWSSRLGEMTFNQIYNTIGRPQEDASAKQFQNWIEYHWWGIKMLKIVAGNCCKPATRPNALYYVVYVNGTYDPVYQQTIFQSGNLSGSADGLTLPAGWRVPLTSELSEDWRDNELHRHAVVEGDLNGDGIADRSMLLVSNNGIGLGLFAFLSQKNHTFKVYKLDEIKDSSILPVIGITKVSRGRYKTACGKGYWACKKGEPTEILIEHDAINFFKVESASSYFYWSMNEEIFKRVWIGD